MRAAPLPVVYCSPEFEHADELERHALNRIGAVEEARREPAVIWLDETLAGRRGACEALGALPAAIAVIAVGPAAEGVAAQAERLFLAVDHGAPPRRRRLALRAAMRHVELEYAAANTRRNLDNAGERLDELQKIGLALMGETDEERLLDMILEQARGLTTSDTGLLHLVEKDGAGRVWLRPRLARSDSIEDPASLARHTGPLDETTAIGWAAAHGRTLRIDDAHDLPAGSPFAHDLEIDRAHGYRTRSVLVAPMIDRKGEVLGVIHLINRKRQLGDELHDEAACELSTLAFTDRDEMVLECLAAQAAVSIENRRLHGDIENLFEGFVRAAVTAIEQRDPSTHGHSERVARLSCDLAEKAARCSDGPLAGVSFTSEELKELRYAALLHDFGKVGVREEVLVKARKLPDPTFQAIRERFARVRAQMAAGYQEQRAEHLLRNGTRDYEAFLGRLEADTARTRDELERYWTAICELNEPTARHRIDHAMLDEIASATFVDVDGRELAYLGPDEVDYLRIERGTLDDEERAAIEEHVRHTYEFLCQIPWTADLAQVAEIAYAHHENPAGTGYPRRPEAELLPLRSRILSVADVFDALTASDRPYKKAVPLERAIEILRAEGRESRLDPEVVELLVASRSWSSILPAA